MRDQRHRQGVRDRRERERERTRDNERYRGERR